MRSSTLLCLSLLLFSSIAGAEEKKVPAALKYTMKSLDGKDVKLDKYKGKVVLMVNVASQCGLTPQYEQLQAMHEKYGEKGLAVLGFPCNQFGAQEPGSAKQIQTFCSTNYSVTFDMFDKVQVNGDNACGLYEHLKSVNTKPKGSGEISWNFEKFLLNRSGEVIGRFEPRIKPNDPAIVQLIEKELKKSS